MVKSLSSIGAKAGTVTFPDGGPVTTRNPLEYFTSFQWFVYQARNTVFYTAYSSKRFDEEMLNMLCERIVSLAPQLTHGFIGARPGQPLPRSLIEEITSIREVDNFEGYPKAWLHNGLDIYDTPHLPLFRVEAAVRKDGPDKDGRQTAIMVRSSHALMEGSDSALLNRSQFSGHGKMNNPDNRVGWLEKLGYSVTAAIVAPYQMILAYLFAPPPSEHVFESYCLERQQLRQAAARLDVRQRAVMFALVMWSMYRNRDTNEPHKIRIHYTNLTDERSNADDDFFRVRAIEAKHVVQGTLPEFIRHVDETLADIESRNIAHRQYVLNALFGVHRFLARFFPFVYAGRFFRYTGPYNTVLTLVPPHRMYGNLTLGMLEPIYCGSYHPGTSICTFVPARKYVTFCFTGTQEQLKDTEEIPDLLASLLD